MEENWKIGTDNICPATGAPCEDETCPPGAICNLKPNTREMRGDLPEPENAVNFETQEELWDEVAMLIMVGRIEEMRKKFILKRV